MLIFGIDPGYTESAYALIRMPDFEVIERGKVPNEDLLNICRRCTAEAVDLAVIEMVACYGMPVGKEVFETCVWIGRFLAATPKGLKFVYRLDEKICLCHDTRANDASIRRALIDRYAKHDLKTGRGTKKDPDVFYGVKSDIWSAIAVCVTAYEKEIEK